MTSRRLLKFIHIAGTLCFVASFGYVLVQALRQAEVSWWVIFSLSGPSAIATLLLICIYLFAIFRGISGSQQAAEHPLTSSQYYMAFYTISPFLGTVAGFIGMYGLHGLDRFLIGVSYATLGATFAVWIIVDPLIGLTETLLPASRRSRAERLTKAAKLKRQKQQKRDQLLDQVIAVEKQNRQKWQQELTPYAAELALLLNHGKFSHHSQRRAATLGLTAWRLGGITCMKHLHKMATEKQTDQVIDFIPIWWDGIGTWQNFNPLQNSG